MVRPRPLDAQALLAMPAADYMNEAQLEFFRALLLEEKASHEKCPLSSL